MSTLVIRLLLLATALFTTCGAAPTKLTLSVTDSNGQSLGAVIVFDGQQAFEYGPNIEGAPLATYNLATPGWTEANGQKVSLEQAKAWAAASKQRALGSIGRVTDPGQRAFTEMLLNPTFSVAADAKQVRLFSPPYLSYSASEALSLEPAAAQAFYAYDELNAYRKAMVLRQAPPFAQLTVTGILQDKGFFPGKLVMQLTTPNGAVEVVTSMNWAPLTPEEAAVFEAR